MQINDHCTFELFDHKKPIRYDEHDEETSGSAHIALYVTNIEAWNAHLLQHNVAFTMPLCTLPHLGKKVLLFKDPNGAVIELCENIMD